MPFGIHLARQGGDKSATATVCERHFVNQRGAGINCAAEKVSPLKDNSSAAIYKQLARSIGQHSHTSSSTVCPFPNVTSG